MAATHACNPYPDGRFVARSEEQDKGGLIGNTLRWMRGESSLIQEAQGYDQEFIRRASKTLKDILPFSWDQMEKYSIGQGWLKQVTDADGTKRITLGTFNADKEGITEAGFANAVIKDFVLGRAGGIKQLADDFRLKTKAGQDATYEGILFLQQLQGLARFGTYVMGFDQQIGRSLRNSKLIRQVPATASEGMYAGTVDAIGNPGQFKGELDSIAQMLNDPNQQQEAIAKMMGLAQRIEFLDDPLKITKATLGLEVAGNAWNEVFINGLLSSPSTFATNALGTAWVPMRALLQFGAAKAWAATGLAGTDEAVLAAAEAGAQLAAMQSGFMEAWQVGWQAFRNEQSLYQTYTTGLNGDRLNTWREAVGKAPLIEGDQFYDNFNRMGRFVRLPGRALLGTDEFARHLATRAEVAARGVRRAARDGVDLTDKAALDKVLKEEADAAFHLQGADLMNPSKEQFSVFKKQLQSYDLDQQAMGQSSPLLRTQEAVFQEPNAVAAGVTNLINRAPVLRPFVPFVRTPLNIIGQGIFQSTGMQAIYKGAGIYMDNPSKGVLAIQQELLKDPAETFRVAGQIALTTTLGTAVWGMAMNGQITGGGPGRWVEGRGGKAAQDAWLAAGNVPYSLNLGGVAIPFDKFGEPLAIWLRMMADAGMASAYMEYEEQEELVAALIGIGASGLYQASFLQGVDTLTKTVQDPEYYLARATQDWFATQTPFGSLLAFVDRTVDPYKSTYENSTIGDVWKVHENIFGTGILGKVAARIPGVNTTPQLIDQITGRPVPIVPGVGPGGINALQMAVPVFPRNNSADPVWNAVFEIQGMYREKSPQFNLTLGEQQDLNTRMANTLVAGKTLEQRIMAFYRRSDVQEFIRNKKGTLPGKKFAIQQELDAIINDHYSIAWSAMEMGDPNITRRQLLQEAMDNARTTNNVQEFRALERQQDDLFERARRGF